MPLTDQFSNRLAQMFTHSSRSRSSKLPAALSLLACLAITPALPPTGRAAESGPEHELPAPFLDANTVAVIGLRPAAFETDPLPQLLAGLLPGPGQKKRYAERLEALKAALRKAEAEELYLVFSLTDRLGEMPFLVMPKAVEVEPEVIAGLWHQWRDQEIRSAEIGAARVYGSPATLHRLGSLRAAPPTEWAAAREAAGDADAWIVLMADEDYRRALEGMQPTLPEVAGGGSIRPLTRGIDWVTSTIEAPPEAAVRIVMQAADAASAARVRELIEESLNQLRDYPPLEQSWPEFSDQIELLTPQTADSQLQWTFDTSSGTLARLVELVAQPLNRIRVDQARYQAMNQIKQLGLAMHNYHATRKHLPAAGSTEGGSQNQLSWRVHLLPYVEETELYKEFHLDEPWDSEHNRKLIPRMPEIYLSPLSQYLPSEGRANYRVPGGEAMMFPPEGEVTFRDVTDGLSNTIMTIEVDDEHAEVWTKPGAFPIDPEQPARGLGGHFPGVFLTGFVDGSARAFPLTLPKETLRALFTRNGGERFDWP